MLELQNITKNFDNQTVIRNLSLQVNPGQHLVILGPSGCGKSTLLKVIAGLLTPSGGDIRLHGQSITHLKTHERRIPLVFQDHLLFPHLTVAENLAFGLTAQSWRQQNKIKDSTTLGNNISAMLDKVQLGAFAARYPSQLSGGQRQRVALARAMILRPQWILMDEPLSHLDSHLRRDMRHLILDLCHENQTTMIMVTHDPQEALSMGSTIGVMAHGCLWEHNQSHLIYNEPQWDITARMMGFENIPIVSRHLPPSEGFPEGKLAMLRPEALGVEKAGPQVHHLADGEISCTEGRLVRLEYEGQTARAVFSSPEGPLVWRGQTEGMPYAELLHGWQQRRDDPWTLSWARKSVRHVLRADPSHGTGNPLA